MRRSLLVCSIAALVAAACLPGSAAAAKRLSFAAPAIVDPARAGGEPTVVALPSGRLLLAAHAGDTHYWRGASQQPDPAFYGRYDGQTYIWRSDDHGRTWTPVTPAPEGLGFSDPDLTIDAGGTVYESEIDLANVTVARSSDGGATWTANPISMMNADREWIAGGAPGELYMTGSVETVTHPPSPAVVEDHVSRGVPLHVVMRSTDGGASWTEQGTDEIGDRAPIKLALDRRTGTLYEPYLAPIGSGQATDYLSTSPPYSTNEIGVSVSTDRGVTWTHRKAGVVQRYAGLAPPSLALDTAGHPYLVYQTTQPDGSSELWMTASANGGRTWTAPALVSGKGTAVFPWAAAGDPGRVGAAWFCSDSPVADLQTDPGTYYICAAVVTGALSGHPQVQRVKATPRPVHVGVVCTNGTACVATGIDRRLGDFLTAAVDASGALMIAYADTQAFPSSAVSRAAFVRQSGGPLLTVKR